MTYQLLNQFLHGDSKIKKYVFDNGLKLIYLQDNTAPLFAYHTWFNVGSKDERPGITGIAHLFEHLMFKETKNLKEGEFDRILESEGGSINAATYLDWTFYRECLPKSAFSLAPKLEADRMKNMILSQAQLDSEREVVANERRFRVDNSPSGTMYEQLYKLAFEKHNYHWPVIGWMEDIQSISLEDCIKFYQTYYAPNNACIVVVGDLDENQVLGEITQMYGDIQSSDIPASQISEEPEQIQLKQKEIQLTVSEPKLLLGYKSPSLNHPDHMALTLLQGILFDGKSSRLEKRLVSEKSVCSEAGGWLDQTADPGLLTMSFSLKEETPFKEVLAILDEEIEKIKKHDISEEELDKIKNIYEYSFWSNYSTMDDKAQTLGFYEATTGDFSRAFTDIEKVTKVTPSEIKAAAQKYLREERQTRIRVKPTA